MPIRQDDLDWIIEHKDKINSFVGVLVVDGGNRIIANGGTLDNSMALGCAYQACADTLEAIKKDRVARLHAQLFRTNRNRS